MFDRVCVCACTGTGVCRCRCLAESLHTYTLILLLLLVLAGEVPLWAVSPLVVFPPAVFGGCPPPVPLLSRVSASFDVFVCRYHVVGREVGQAPGRRRTVNTETSKLAATRDKGTGGGQPPNRNTTSCHRRFIIQRGHEHTRTGN